MSRHLFLVTIGPVQEFIAAARRTRDLWAGSQLLSRLSRVVAETLRDRYEATLIFPAQTDLYKHEVVNRILAELPDGRDPEQVGQGILKKLDEQLEAIAKETFDTIPGLRTSPLRANAEKQVANLIEIFWAAVPSTEDYRQDRTDLEAALAARKNTRTFRQPTWSSIAPKSSIDGMRESVIDEDAYPKRGDDPERDQKIDSLFLMYGAKGAERLSGVDLLKRHYEKRDDHADFPSTSHFAALPLLKRCQRSGIDITKGLNTYLQTLRHTYRDHSGGRRLESMKLDRRFSQLNLLDNYDASILFTSRLEEDLQGELLKQARDALANYRKLALGNKEPEPYYALLHADGDFMGRTIDSLAAKGVQQHRSFSQTLDTFASEVRMIVEGEQHLGALVYSGGDDVLAFLPIHTVLSCAKKLADSFQTLLAQFSFDDKKTKRRVAPTLSVGIVICHHLEPLSDALRLVREAEREAKRVPSKNGLAITLSKRGSGDRTISGSWDSLLYKRLSIFIEAHRDEKLPDGAAYDLLNLAERLGPAGAELHEPMRREALRILGRKRGQRGNEPIAQETVDLVRTALGLRTEIDGGPQEQEHFRRSVEQIADELILTREFARALGLKPRHAEES